MAGPTTLLTRSPSHVFDPAGRETFEHRLRRRDVFRRSAIMAAALAVATLVVGVSFLVGNHLVAAWWIESQGGLVLWDIDKTNWQQGGATTVSFSAINFWNARLGNGDLSHLRRLRRVISVNLAENEKITNKGLAALRGLDSLAELNLERLTRYRLASGILHSKPLTDACLVHLRALPRLEKLTLAGNVISDRGLSEIAKMANLTTLDLSATEVTDAGLLHLEGMKKLKTVNLGATWVSKEGIAQLRLARPDLTIEFDIEPAVEEQVMRLRGAIQ